MRRAYSEYDFITEDDKFIGISLGYDYCAEHEWGIEDMKHLFGVPKLDNENLGVKSRSITICPDSLIFREMKVKKNEYAILYTAYSWNNVEERLPHDLENYDSAIQFNIKENEPPLITAWDGSSFGIVVFGEKEISYLKELYDAFKNKNIAITPLQQSKSNPFSRGTIALLIIDRLPENAIEGMYAADEDYLKK